MTFLKIHQTYAIPKNGCTIILRLGKRTAHLYQDLLKPVTAILGRVKADFSPIVYLWLAYG